MLQRTIRTLIFVFCVMTSMIVSAQQIQHGYVKTRGKLIDGKVIAGKRVPNVAITIDGVNTIISNNTGEFSFPVRKESFSIRSVHKSGYSLVDNNILNQEFCYSSSPLVIVVEENSELTQEKIRITRQIRLSLQRKLEEKEEELNKQRAQNKITSDEYNSLIKEVYEEHSRNEGLIENIVDYSMGIDYSMLDEYNALVQENITAGNLAKADSLINYRDLSQRLLQLDKIRLELQDYESQIESAINEHLRLKKSLAEELKIRSQLYIQENKLDSALICLSNRIELDSTFYEHYLDKAILLRDKFPERTHESEILFAKSISHAIENPDKFISAIEYGAYYQQIGEFDKAMLQYSNALNYIETEDSISKANVLTKLGIAYNSMRNYEEALSYYQQALLYVTPTQINYQKRSAELYNNIGVVYENLSKYGRALDAHYKALQIRQELYATDQDNPDIGMSYSNIASVYDNIEAWEQAINYYLKAIEIFKKNKGKSDIALCYNNIASTYFNADMLDFALKNSILSFVEIRKISDANNPILSSIRDNLYTIESELPKLLHKIKKEDILALAKSQFDIGEIFKVYKDYDYSLYYYQQSLKTYAYEDIINFADPLKLAEVFESCGDILSMKDEYLTYKQNIFPTKSLLSEINLPDGDLEREIELYQNKVSSKQNIDYYKACDYYDNAIRLYSKAKDKKSIVRISAIMSSIYFSLSNKSKSDEYYENISEIINSANSPIDSVACHDIAVMFYQANDYTHAAACWDWARQKVMKFGKNYEKMLNSMAMCYNETGDQKGIAHVMALMEEHNQHELTLPCDEPDCMVDRAEYFASTGDNAKAKGHYLKVLQMPMTDAQKAEVYESYAKFNFNLREYTQAKEFYLMAANAKKSVEGETEDYIQLVYKTAIYSYLCGLYDQSLTYYHQVIAYYEKRDSDAARKNIAQCHKGMGNSLSAMKRYAEARDEHKLVVAYYEKYDKANEEYPNAIERVATAEKFNKEYDASIDHYKQAIAFYIERGISEKAHDTQNSLNLCYAYAGRQLENYEQLFLQNPDAYRTTLAECYNSKSYEYAKTNDFVSAHKSIDKAISLLPDNANFYDSKGEILFMQGKNEEALEMWKKVLELNPDFLKDYPDGTNLSNGLKKLGLIE